jgi:hypothetical protein
VPVWHATLKAHAAAGKIALLGVIQEQHAERCRLFAQWQRFDWPILHDPINVLEPAAVPVFVAIDEHGIVRHTRPTPEWVVETFLHTNYEAPARPVASAPAAPPDRDALKRAAAKGGTAAAWRAVGDALFLWGGPSRIGEAVAAYESAVERDPVHAPTHFRLGVAQRMRFESPARVTDDFQSAVASWERALDIDPNHYIYRRRIQQYGPRLIKPYPFYDWVTQARQEIAGRGETPVALEVEPSGAEIAQPARELVADADRRTEPDPRGRVQRDERELIGVTPVVVPARIAPGGSARVHVEFRPRAAAHWNNEAEPVHVWIAAPDAWTLERQSFTLPLPEAAESRETRRLEFELQAPADLPEDAPRVVSGYALYYVCEEAEGQCLYLRRDFTVTVAVASGGQSRRE